MNKWKTSLNYIRLTLVFVFVVFLIMLVTMFLIYCRTFLFAHKYLDIIISEFESLVSLSTNVLYLSKIEQQALLLNRKHFLA